MIKYNYLLKNPNRMVIMNDKTLILRPMMKIYDMVPYLKNKNIKFECCSEQDAEIYLKENNNYYNVTS